MVYKIRVNSFFKLYAYQMYLAFSSKLGYEEHIPGQTRDWNEELQTTRELSRKNLPERLMRERAIFKVELKYSAINRLNIQTFCS